MASVQLGTLPRSSSGVQILICHHTPFHQVIPEAFTCSLLLGRSWAKFVHLKCWVLQQSSYALDVYYYKIKVGIYNSLIK